MEMVYLSSAKFCQCKELEVSMAALTIREKKDFTMAFPLSIPNKDTTSPGVILGLFDRRSELNSAISQPYCWICSLTASFSGNGNTILGTGFLLNIPKGNTQCIITAGSVVFDRDSGKTASYIEYQFPDDQSTRIEGRYIKVPQRFMDDPNSLNDYALVIIPEPMEIMDFGYSLSIPDDQLMRLTCNLFGYSGKPPRYILGSGGAIQSVSSQQLYYNVDASRGQRGTPLYAWWDWFLVVVGIHIGGYDKDVKCNVATRLNIAIIKDILALTSNPMYLPKKIKSNAFTGVCLKIMSPDSSGNISVIAHYSDDKTDPSVLIRLIPIVGLPSSIDTLSSDMPDDIHCAISSASLKDAYFYLDATGIDAGHAEGGMLDARIWTDVPEMRFVVQKSSNGKLRMLKRDADQSIYLRVNGSGVKAATPDGAVGSAGCKLITNVKDLTQISFCELLIQ